VARELSAKVEDAAMVREELTRIYAAVNR